MKQIFNQCSKGLYLSCLLGSLLFTLWVFSFLCAGYLYPNQEFKVNPLHALRHFSENHFSYSQLKGGHFHRAIEIKSLLPHGAVVYPCNSSIIFSRGISPSRQR